MPKPIVPDPMNPSLDPIADNQQQTEKKTMKGQLQCVVATGGGLQTNVRPIFYYGEKAEYPVGALLDANRTAELIQQAKEEIIGVATPETLDTLQELAEAMENDANLITSMDTKLQTIAEGAEVNIQSDWNQQDEEADDFIKNKPDLSSLQERLEYLENKLIYNNHDYVDLGLPSGTKWATMNVGANSITDYGNYYMYGMGSKTYDSTDTPYAGTENPLATSADTAAQVWGGEWHTPTKTQIEELINNTTVEYTQIEGVNGNKFTSQNGKYIFIPACGWWNDNSKERAGQFAAYWSSTLDQSMPYYFYFFTSSVSLTTNSRNYGYSIRPVIN